MKKYKVTVNGTAYEVELEVIDKADVKAAPAAAQAPKAEAAPVAAPAPAAKAPVAEGGESITSPMPGTVLDIKVKNGDTVKKGDVVIILEAMKMENEIMAPCDGVVASLNVTKGESVDTGATICVIA